MSTTSVVAMTMVSVAVILLGVALVIGRIRDRHAPGDDGYVQAEVESLRALVHMATELLSNLGPQIGIDDSDFLSMKSKKAVRAWLALYADHRNHFADPDEEPTGPRGWGKVLDKGEIN